MIILIRNRTILQGRICSLPAELEPEPEQVMVLEQEKESAVFESVQELVFALAFLSRNNKVE